MRITVPADMKLEAGLELSRSVPPDDLPTEGRFVKFVKLRQLLKEMEESYHRSVR